MKKILPVYHETKFTPYHEDYFAQRTISINTAKIVFNPACNYVPFASLFANGDDMYMYNREVSDTCYLRPSEVVGKTITPDVMYGDRCYNCANINEEIIFFLPGLLSCTHNLNRLAYALVFDVNYQNEVRDLWVAEGQLHQHHVKFFILGRLLNPSSMYSDPEFRRAYRDHIKLDLWKQRIEIIKVEKIDFLENRFRSEASTMRGKKEEESRIKQEFKDFAYKTLKPLSERELRAI